MRIIQANVPGEGLHEIHLDGAQILKSESLGPAKQGALSCWRGFVDLQLNGFAGVDFNLDQPDPESIVSVLGSLFSTGVTTFLPTLVTNKFEVTISQLAALEQARKASAAFDRAVPGYHLEGPWLSSGSSHGAHDQRQIRLPNREEFDRCIEASSARIRLITIAPELPGALELIRYARAQKITVSIGHSDGTATDIYQAVAAGATLLTHLGNGCPQMLDRHTAPFWAQLAEDCLGACIICDNFHVSPELIKIIARVKGLSNCILVTDAMQAAMMPSGAYRIANTEAELLSTGQVVRMDRKSMAGSALTMDRAVTNFKEATGCSLPEALNAATENPLSALGCPRATGKPGAGKSADLVLFEMDQDSLRVRETILGGERVWKA